MITPRPSPRWMALVALVLASLLSVAPAAGGPATDKGDKHDGALARIGLEVDREVPAVIKLHCRSHVADAPAVGCAWRVGADADIASFQLWKLQVAPTEGSRTLVAELGADAARHTDADVEAPAAYLYAVLGLNADGEIVARSRVTGVRIGDPAIAPLRLDCGATDREVPTIWCGWSSPSDVRIASFVLYRTSPGDDRVAVARLGADATGYADTEIECGIRYRYAVIGLDADGEMVARSRADAAGCAERDHERDRERDHERDRERDTAERDVARDLTDHERDEPHRTDEPSDAPSDRATTPVETSDGDSVVAAVPVEPTDEHRSVDSSDRPVRRERPSDATDDRRGRGR